MLAYGWLVGTTVLGASIATAALLLWIVSRTSAAGEGSGTRAARDGDRRCVALFDEGALHDATPARPRPDRRDPGARATRAGGSWASSSPASARCAGRWASWRRWAPWDARSADGARLEARWCDGLARIEVFEPGGDPRPGRGRARRVASERDGGRAADAARRRGAGALADLAHRPRRHGGLGQPGLRRARRSGRRQGAPRLAPAGALRGRGAAAGARPGPSACAPGAPPGPRPSGRRTTPRPGSTARPGPGGAPGAAMRYAAPAAAALRAERSLEQFTRHPVADLRPTSPSGSRCSTPSAA